jgi:cardiolipin synthase C
VRILTNSLSATDVALVHAGYAKRRKPLLRRGVRIYELMAAFRHSETHARWQHGIGSSSASLHAKTFSVDRRRVFVGSLNLDPRSIRLNTEMGLVIESAALAEAVASEFDEAVRLDAYEVILAADGQLEWVEPGGEVRHRREPNTTLLKRLIVRLLAWLPIEWLL